MPYHVMCPMCGRWLRRPEYADDVLECPDCGPAVFLGKEGRDSDAVLDDVSEQEAATGAAKGAIRALGRLFAGRIGGKA